MFYVSHTEMTRQIARAAYNAALYRTDVRPWMVKMKQDFDEDDFGVEKIDPWIRRCSYYIAALTGDAVTAEEFAGELREQLEYTANIMVDLHRQTLNRVGLCAQSVSRSMYSRHAIEKRRALRGLRAWKAIADSKPVPVFEKEPAIKEETVVKVKKERVE